MTGPVNMDSSFQPVTKEEHLRYGRTGRSRRRSMRMAMLAISLAVMSLILVAVSIYSAVHISTLKQNKQQLELALGNAQDQLSVLGPELEKVKADLNELVNRRIPGLHELQTDKVMELPGGDIKNIMFTIVRRAQKNYYKYLLVVENNHDDKLIPSFKVLLFDRNGLHVATHKVEDSHMLAPGEIRDYTSEVDFLFETQPHYFYIDNLTSEAAR